MAEASSADDLAIDFFRLHEHLRSGADRESALQRLVDLAVASVPGCAWAAVTAPGAGSIWDRTAVEARVDPGADQSKVGATITKAVPLIDEYNLSLQNGYHVTQQGMVPLPGAAPRTNRSFDADQSAKLSMGGTGTSLTAGQTLSSGDDKWLRHVGAEQKLADGITVSGAIGETAQGATSKSITAGFKKSW